MGDIYFILGDIDQNSLFTSYYCPVQLIAHYTDQSEETGDFFMEEVIWTNKSANSPFGQCPLRFAMEKESHQNSLAEGNRLEQEAETLKPHHDHKSDKNVEFVCLPTEVDGKVKFVWSKTTTSMQNCYVCGGRKYSEGADVIVISPNRQTELLTVKSITTRQG